MKINLVYESRRETRKKEPVNTPLLQSNYRVNIFSLCLVPLRLFTRPSRSFTRATFSLGPSDTKRIARGEITRPGNQASVSNVSLVILVQRAYAEIAVPSNSAYLS